MTEEHDMLNDYYQNIGLKGFLKRYGVVNAIRRGIFMANPVHYVKSYEVRKVLWQSSAAESIKPYLKYKDIDVKGIEYPAKSVEDPVWIFWDKGIDNSPVLVKKCVESIEQYASRDVIFLTNNNLNKYIKLPDYIERKKDAGQIPMAGYTDIMRVALLEHYGGTWIDSTVYLTDYIPDVILNSDFFAFRNSLLLIENPVLYPAWFLHAKKGNKTIREVRNVAFAYWLKNEHMVEYLLPNLIITLVLKEDPESEKKIPYMNSDYSEYLIKVLSDKYSEKKFEWIKSLTSIHKLSYKLDEGINKEGNFYRYIIENVPMQGVNVR